MMKLYCLLFGHEYHFPPFRYVEGMTLVDWKKKTPCKCVNCGTLHPKEL